MLYAFWDLNFYHPTSIRQCQNIQSIMMFTIVIRGVGGGCGGRLIGGGSGVKYPFCRSTFDVALLYYEI